MKWFLRTMPGFRTEKWWKKVIALAGYLTIIITVVYLPKITVTDKILDVVFYIFLFGIPFALITNLGAIRGKLPLFQEGEFLYTVMGWCLSLMLTFVLASGVLAATDNLHSKQYKEQAGIIDYEPQVKNLEVVEVASEEKIELLKTINAEARGESHQISVDKALANAKAVEEKKAAETKAIEDKTANDAKAIADKAAADAKVIEAEKAADAKAIENRNKWISTQNQLKIKKTTNAQVIDEKAAYQAWVKAQFSLSSGENMRFVELIKKPLNDDTSFSHIKTTYVDKGDYLIIDMTYRAKNADGELMVQNATAKSDYKTNIISVIS